LLPAFYFINEAVVLVSFDGTALVRNIKTNVCSRTF
jgi:hypothetical protein